MKTCKIIIPLAGLIAAAFLSNAQTATPVVYRYAFFTQVIPVNQYEGKRFKLSASLKVNGPDEQSAATIFAQVKLRNGKPGFRTNPAQTLGNYKEWKTITLTGKIDSDASVIELGGYTKEKGEFLFDSFELQVEQTPDKWRSIVIPNGDFEQGGMQSWISGTTAMPLQFDGVSYDSERTHPFAGKSSLKLVARYINYGSNADNGNYATVNGIKLYYETYGEGKPLVLLHGNGGSIANQSARISFFKSKYKVIAIDSRAQGKSGDDGKELTYDLMADDINQLLEQIHIDSAYFWGQSDGGIIALEMGMRYPKKVKKLAAWGANIQADSSAFTPGIYKSIAVEAKSSDPRKRKLNTLMLNYPHLSFSALSAIKVPALVMAGDRDAISPEHTLKIYQSLPKGQLFIMPGATHSGAYEKPNLFNQVLQDFLNQP
ncbi:alpha/beta fold hydrolase [Mucilaginibacter sp. UR6-11]|uniref:alpha/beta fold hydrolase n=1 Tax=Mucilaginibacter sp. UR6-11 TaxID=1435644 RepID=UPI001E2D84E0|nr:alpha/beta hydrolase [Mucilaginibacter sp. UR6-11]MCC8424997.1 alpha/beta hydrolase [Mucilaginibacter sp. UR6-11]